MQDLVLVLMGVRDERARANCCVVRLAEQENVCVE
jgi:hypothetical protein